MPGEGWVSGSLPLKSCIVAALLECDGSFECGYLVLRKINKMITVELNGKNSRRTGEENALIASIVTAKIGNFPIEWPLVVDSCPLDEMR